MFDTMTLTKITAGACGALLVFLLGNFAAESIYASGGGHGDDHHKQGYLIEVADTPTDSGPDEGPSLDELLAAADLGKGAKVFGKCKSCHKLEDGANSTGPFLYGVVDRPIGSVDGFSYSGGFADSGDNWNAANLDAFLTKPKAFAPKTSMGFSGLKKPADRANLIAYLDSLDN